MDRNNEALIIELARLFEENRQGLFRYVQACFPTFCASRVEDAVYSAFLAAVEHPDRFEKALESGGEGMALGLFRVIAWRSARGTCVRKSYKLEVTVGDMATVCSSRPAGQEVAVAFSRRFDQLLDEASQSCNVRQAEAIRAALLDKFYTGDPDTVVARRTGVRREYVNRAKRHVLESLLGAA